MAVPAILLCISLCLTQVISVSMTSSSNSNEDVAGVNVFLSVAEAVKEVERAGGARKMLEYHKSKKIPRIILEILHGLVKIEEKPQQKEDISDRFLGLGFAMRGVKFIVNTVNTITNLITPDEATTANPIATLDLWSTLKKFRRGIGNKYDV